MVIRDARNPFVHPSGDIPPWFRRPADTRLAELEAQVLELQSLLQEANERIRQLEKGQTAVSAKPFADNEPKLYEGRPVITCAEAAKRGGVSLTTVSRYLNSKYWQGTKRSHYEWYVFADQEFTRKERQKGRRVA